MDSPQPFRVSKSAVFKTLISTPSPGWIFWLIMSAGIILLAIGCFGDLRILILGLIIVFTLVPATALFIYVGCMFSSKCVANLLPHTVEHLADRYLIRIFRQADNEDRDRNEMQWIELGRISLPYSNVVAKKVTQDYVMVIFKDSEPNILYIPR